MSRPSTSTTTTTTTSTTTTTEKPIILVEKSLNSAFREMSSPLMQLNDIPNEKFKGNLFIFQRMSYVFKYILIVGVAFRSCK